MKIAVIALTRNGSEMAYKLGEELDADIYLKKEFLRNVGYPITIDFISFVGSIFGRYDALVFVMASGIVVRSVAPYIKDKRIDPAVIVMDEKGKFCISLLSGHIGGANRLAREIASRTGGTAVITTSTDVNDMVAFDVFAAENECVIENIKEMKHVSSELVNGGRVALYSDYKINGALPDNIVAYESLTDPEIVVVLSNRTNIELPGRKFLLIRPKNLILGIGCKRGTTAEQIKTAVQSFMNKNEKSFLSVKRIATIDLKQDEPGLLEFCSQHGVDLYIVPREDIKQVEDNFTCSEFVKKRVGVASVAEPCSVLVGKNTRLICGKTLYNGITLALSEEVKDFYI